MKAVILKPFPYSDNGNIIRFFAGDTFDFPARQYAGLKKEGFIGDEDSDATAHRPPAIDGADAEEKKPRGRKPKAMFQVGANVVPGLDE